MINEQLISGPMTITVKPSLFGAGHLMVICADQHIGVTLGLTQEQATGLCAQLQARLAPKDERELVGV